LTIQTADGILQSDNKKERIMDITEVGSYISEIKEALQGAISDAETKENNIESKVEELSNAKQELEMARGEVEELFNSIEDFDGDRLSNAIDEAINLGIED
jgi:DNA repair exonuclease SbcCD ATPase subunit|tara:strand:+ start:235 stop:537 length:303 start_codon:yes stop_codon:yes gene_type:complete